MSASGPSGPLVTPVFCIMSRELATVLHHLLDIPPILSSVISLLNGLRGENAASILCLWVFHVSLYPGGSLFLGRPGLCHVCDTLGTPLFLGIPGVSRVA